MKRLLSGFTLILILSACSEKDKKGNPLDTPTAGSIKIAVDESLKPLLDAEVKAFTGIYQNTNLDVIYSSESKAIDLLIKDSTRLAIITRTLTNQEKQLLANQAISAKELVVAHEGIALILNTQNPDTLLTQDQLKKILNGEISSWTQINKKSKHTKLEVVFDKPASGTLRYLQDSLAIPNLAAHCFGVQTNPAVVEYVTSHPDAIGVIGVSWISDVDDSVTNDFLKNIRVVSLQHDSAFYKPYQAFIAQKHYPLIRKVYIISREARTGLGSGFTAFVAGDKGQRVVLKAGLVPATMPIRIIEVSNEPLEY